MSPLRFVSVVLALGSVSVPLASCGPPRPPGQQASLDGTAIGKHRCADAKTKQLSPFVVEWDATDLSGFEARASRDLVFVKYEGCELTVLEGCNDGAIPGRYGRYGQPHFTSGTDESLKIQNEDELYANLPLGVASFGGRVSMGESLELRYHVTALATATRDTVPRSDLAPNPQCREATHFVYAYHLGAFELGSSKKTAASANAGVGDVGGGGEHKHEERSLKRGGDLANCSTQAQTACRTPIRLVLREVGESGAASGDQPAASGAAPTIQAPPRYEETPGAQAMALRDSARNKESNAGDGAGCLEDLDRADKLDPSGAHGRGPMYTRAVCLMRAGKCDEGKKLFREFLVAADKDHEQTDAALDQSTQATADAKCPSSSGTLAERVKRAIARIGEATHRKNGDACLEEAKGVEALLPGIPKSDVAQRNLANGVLMQAAICLAAASRCDEAKKLYFRYYDAQFTGTMPAADIKRAAETTFPSVAPGCKK